MPVGFGGGLAYRWVGCRSWGVFATGVWWRGGGGGYRCCGCRGVIRVPLVGGGGLRLFAGFVLYEPCIAALSG